RSSPVILAQEPAELSEAAAQEASDGSQAAPLSSGDLGQAESVTVLEQNDFLLVRGQGRHSRREGAGPLLPADLLAGGGLFRGEPGVLPARAGAEVGLQGALRPDVPHRLAEGAELVRQGAVEYLPEPGGHLRGGLTAELVPGGVGLQEGLLDNVARV